MSVLDASKDDVLSTNLFAYCGNNPVNHSDPSGYFYLSLKKLGKVFLIIGLNPLGSFLIGYGLWRLRRFLVRKYVLLLAKLVSFMGPIAKVITFIIGAGLGIPIVSDIAAAVWDCIMQRKKGIEFGFKKTRKGIPYAFNIYAR